MRRGDITAAGLLIAALTLPAGAQEDADTRPPTDLESAVEDVVERSPAPEVMVIGRRIGDGVPRVPLNSVGSRDVFGPKRVRETGARDINDLIINVPAISTRPYNGGEAAAPSFSIRGMPDDGLTEYVNVLIDGVPASPLPYGWTAFSFLPITVERIHALDLVRGAYSVRYSPNTVGGVLNFVTRPIPTDPTLSFRQTLGNLGYSSSMFSIGATQDNLGVLFTAVTRGGDGYRREGDFDQEDTNLKLRFDTEPGGFLAASVTYMQSDHQAPGGLTLAEFSRDRFDNTRKENRFEGHRQVADVLWHRPWDNGWVEGFAYASETSRRLIAQRPHFGTPTSLLDWTDDSEVLGLGARFTRDVELGGTTHTFFGGMRHQRERLPSWKIDSSPFPGGPKTLARDSRYALDAWSVHLDDTFEPVERLTVTVGLRGEWITQADGNDALLGFDFDDEFDQLLPGVGASYLVNDSWAVFANRHEGFRAPQVWGFGSSAPGEGLDLEEGTSSEIGVRCEGVGGVSGSLTRWRNEFDDFGVFFTGFYENLGELQADGVDVDLEWDVGTVAPELAGLSVSVSMTDQDSELRSGPDRGKDTPYAWDRKAAWRLRYATNDGWVVSLGGNRVGPSFSDAPNTRAESTDGTLGRNPSRTLWDTRISRTFDLSDRAALEVAVGATNVFDEEWFVHSRGGFFGGGKVAGPPRQTFASIALDLSW